MKGAIGELFGVISVPVSFFWQGITQFFSGIAQSMVLYKSTSADCPFRPCQVR